MVSSANEEAGAVNLRNSYPNGGLAWFNARSDYGDNSVGNQKDLGQFFEKILKILLKIFTKFPKQCKKFQKKM